MGTISQEAVLFERLILNYVTKGNGEKYENSLREFIIERAKETGIMRQIDTAMKSLREIREMMEEINFYYRYW